MQMTDSEIVRRYKHAIDKKSMIGILADLNACDKTKIREILTAAGLNVGKLNGPGRPKKTPEQAMKIETPEKEVIPFYVSGKEDEPSAEVTEETTEETKNTKATVTQFIAKTAIVLFQRTKRSNVSSLKTWWTEVQSVI